MDIFLSSTFLDLIEHRKAATNGLEQLGLRVGRMEIFGARPEEPVAACLREIAACDLFVGIYAQRYGYIPSGSNSSITEQEFEIAQECHKPTFCFLLDDTFPWPEEFIEEEPGYSLLSKFKNRIGSSVVFARFREPQDLACKVVAAVGRYLSQHPQLLIIPPEGEAAKKQREDLINLLEFRKEAILLNIKNERDSATTAIERTSRSPSNKLLNLLNILFIGYIGLKNNQNRINRFQRGAECAIERLEYINRIEALFLNLHQRNISAIRHGELLYSHELTSEIHALLWQHQEWSYPASYFESRPLHTSAFQHTYPHANLIAGPSPPYEILLSRKHRIGEELNCYSADDLRTLEPEFLSNWWSEISDPIQEQLDDLRTKRRLEQEADERGPVQALIGANGRTRCPHCSIRINTADRQNWNGDRCPRCRTHLELVTELPIQEEHEEYHEHEIANKVCVKCGCSLGFIKRFGYSCTQ